MRIESQKVTFEGATGAELAARLDRPTDREVRGYALFAHCFTCSKEVFAASRVSKSLAEQGLATLRFDFTGLGHSDGEFANTNFSSNVGDLLAAVDYLAEHHESPSLLVGHSLGGAAALVAGEKVDGLDAIATIGAPCHPEHVRNLFDGHIEEIEASGEAEVTLAGRTFRIQKQFLEDLGDQEMEERIGRLRTPLMVFHSPIDNTVGIDNAGRIFKAAKHPKSFVSLDDADHLLTRKEDARYVGTVLSAWASRYLGQEEEAEAERPDVDVAPGSVYVGETGEGKFSNHVLSGPHYLRADEPEEVGGDDSGPSPYDLLTAGLGACTSMTLRMYANHKGIEVEKFEVFLEHEKIHAKDCEECESDGDEKIDRIERRIRITGDVDQKTRERMVQIADKCPVHNTLDEGNNKIVTKLDE